MSRRTDIQAKLAELGVQPKKAFGQNFLFDPNGISKVLEFADVSGEDAVIEIGPGLGALSRSLAERSRRYIAIEIEERFAENLKHELRDIAHAKVLHADARDVDVKSLGTPADRWTLVSNVPYSVSSEFIVWMIDQWRLFCRAALLFQREFAERVAAVPGGKEYGSLSVQSQLVADVRLGPRLGGGLFYPSASVESRLVSLRFLSEPRVTIDCWETYRATVRAAFGKRRKTLENALLAAELASDRAAAERLFQLANIESGRRGETLSAVEFAALANAIARSR